MSDDQLTRFVSIFSFAHVVMLRNMFCGPPLRSLLHHTGLVHTIDVTNFEVS